MNQRKESFSHLLEQSIEQEIRDLQMHPEEIVTNFEANERVAGKLELLENLQAASRFLSEKLGLEASVIDSNVRPEIRDPETMMTRVEYNRPEYLLELMWEFDGRERRFKLVVGKSGKEVRVIQGINGAETIESYKDGQLDYEGVHKRVGALLFYALRSDFSVARSKPAEEVHVPTTA